MCQNVVVAGLDPESRPLNRQGFTLIELLVVVLIIGILASIALPQYQTAVAKSRFVQGMGIMDTLWRAQQAYYMANGAYAVHLEDLDVAPPAGMVKTASGSTSESWADGQFQIILYVEGGQAARLDMVMQKSGGEAQYVRFFNTPGITYCYARTTSSLWNKVCKSLGGTLSIETGFWNIYNLP